MCSIEKWRHVLVYVLCKCVSDVCHLATCFVKSSAFCVDVNRFSYVSGFPLYMHDGYLNVCVFACGGCSIEMVTVPHRGKKRCTCRKLWNIRSYFFVTFSSVPTLLSIWLSRTLGQIEKLARLKCHPAFDFYACWIELYIVLRLVLLNI